MDHLSQVFVWVRKMRTWWVRQPAGHLLLARVLGGSPLHQGSSLLSCKLSWCQRPSVALKIQEKGEKASLKGAVICCWEMKFEASAGGGVGGTFSCRERGGDTVCQQ